MDCIDTAFLPPEANINGVGFDIGGGTCDTYAYGAINEFGCSTDCVYDLYGEPVVCASSACAECGFCRSTSPPPPPTTPPPTHAPTNAPSFTPTHAPSFAPTQSPTVNDPFGGASTSNSDAGAGIYCEQTGTWCSLPIQNVLLLPHRLFLCCMNGHEHARHCFLH